jgi:type VII secretion protein EssA
MKKFLLSFVLMVIWFWPIVSHAEDETVPKEQKQLTFEEVEAPNSEQIEKQLFQTAIRESNTVQAKTAQIGLFSNPDTTVKMEAETQTEEAASSIMVLMIISVIIIIMFIFILPKIKQKSV